MGDSMKRIQQARRAVVIEQTQRHQRRQAMRRGEQRHTSAEEVLELETQEHRAALIAQIDFPWADDEDVSRIPDDAPRTEAQERKRVRLWRQWELDELLVDLVCTLDEIAYDKRKPCRCVNQESCDCVASEMVRTHRKSAREAVTRLRTVLGMPTGKALPAPPQSGVSPSQI